jgi:hypothetical protein
MGSGYACEIKNASAEMNQRRRKATANGKGFNFAE